MGRLFDLVMIAGAAAALVAAAPAFAVETIAVMPLRARGLTPAEYRRVQGRVSAAFREGRGAGEVILPDEIAARLGRDERRRAALEDARRISSEAQERSRALEHREAIDRYDRAISISRDHLLQYSDAGKLADLHLRRAAERLSVNDAPGARSDFLLAVTLAPESPPSLDDYPPPVVEGWEAARLDRVRRPLGPDDGQEIAALAAALGTSAVATTRAEKGDRPDDPVAIEMS